MIGKPANFHRANPDGTINNNIGKTIGAGKHKTTSNFQFGRTSMIVWGKSNKP